MNYVLDRVKWFGHESLTMRSQSILGRRSMRELAKQNGWSVSDRLIEKDGYEIFFHTDGMLEVAIRNPETTEKEAILTSPMHESHPAYHALVLYLIENVEKELIQR